MDKASLGILFSSKTELWATPQDFFNEANQKFHFSTDVCAVPENTKCRRFFSPLQDALKQPWKGRCWMNPPYGRGLGNWVKKAYESGRSGATVVCLLPARTDTKWWHDYVMQSQSIRFVRGRLKFGDGKNSAPFPSVVVVFGPGPAVKKLERWSDSKWEG